MNHSPISLKALFFGFAKVGLSGFGGVLPFARHYFVEAQRWLSAEEFNQILGLCQFLPGPNIVNLSVLLGRRYGGWRGALMAPLGLLLGPICVALVLGGAYDHWGQQPEVRSVLTGIAAAGCGLLIATAFKMAMALKEKMVYWPFTTFVFLAIGFFHWSMPLVMLGCLLFSGGVAYARLGMKHDRSRVV